LTLWRTPEYKEGMHGRKLLSKWMESKGWKQADIVRATGVDDSLFSRWLSGDRGPSLRSAVLLEKLTHGEVPVESWV